MVRTGRSCLVTEEKTLQAQWREPVVLSVQATQRHSIESAREAMDSMMHWPWRHTKAYRKAVRTCLFALVGERTPEKARKAFVAAAKEAQYLVQG